jgi:serine/threonine-protein kinase
MTELSYSAASLCELQTDDEVHIGNIPYFVSRFSRGGMGFVVFLIRDDERAFQSHVSFVHGPNVAIKTMLPAEGDVVMKILFERELTVWAGLDHQNIITLNEILDTRSDGRAAAMDWCVGSLRSFLDEAKSLSLDSALFIIRDLVAGLHYAYKEQGVLHLDLKPANILFKHFIVRMLKYKEHPVKQYLWKVSDWGLASVKNATIAKLVNSTSLGSEAETINNLGTVGYMAPERFIRGTTSSLASDLYAIGLVLYEMLIGCLPYQRSNPDIAEQICSHSYFHTAKLTLNQKQFPKRLVEIILCLISPFPENRCCSYQELLERLNQFERSRSILFRIFNQ